jgi:hypothetical protein
VENDGEDSFVDSGPGDEEQFLGVKDGANKSGSESGSMMGRVSRNGTLTKGLLRLMSKKK